MVGCSIVSPGCTNCYAMRMAGRLELMGSPIYRVHTVQTKAGAVWNGTVATSNWGQMIKPLLWKKARRIFVNSMSDLFHEDMPLDVIDQVFAVMALCPQHTFQLLTKRHARMHAYMQTFDGRRADSLGAKVIELGHKAPLESPHWPLPNVWMGVSVENQTYADQRIPALLDTPAAVRFLSCEPLLGPLGLGALDGIDWVIAGGESGPKRRPMDIQWMRDIKDQCASAGVPFFAKQWDKVHALPSDLLIRQFPSCPNNTAG